MRRTSSSEKTELKKGPWTPEEDQKLVDYVDKHGPGNWRHLPTKAGLQRCGKSCRLRWTNYLRPDIKRGKFTLEEEEVIIQLHSVMGNKWSAIAAKLPGRTDNEIKNYWNTHIRKKLLGMGIDPVTHGPRLDLLDLQSILNPLHQTCLLNIPTLLNLQALLNPKLLNLATSLVPSQNETLTSTLLGKTLNYSTFDKPNSIENLSNFSNIKTNHSWFLENGQPNADLGSNLYAPRYDHGSIYQSNENDPSSINNNSGISSEFSSPCSSLGQPPLAASYTYLNSNEVEIDCFFSNILKKLENTDDMLNVCIS
ncbi:hypothetical protein vseg_009019 [Gypsophila vaccaria]